MKEDSKFETALQNVIEALKAPKDLDNTFGHYKYRSAESILEAVKPLLKKEGLRLKESDELVQFSSVHAPETVEMIDSKGSKYTDIIGGDRFYIKATVTVTGFGESDSADGWAREAQNKKGMDDAQITGSASSYARKYALNGMFDIDDTKDPDYTNNEPKPNTTFKPSVTKPASDAQKEFIANLLKQKDIPISEMAEWLATNYGIEKGRMTQADASMVLDDLKTDDKDEN